MNSAIIIGCTRYDDPDIAHLRYADRDADQFAGALISHCGFQRSEIEILVDGPGTPSVWPTRANVLRSLSKGKKLQNRSINCLVVYFSGHGFHSSRDQKEYLAPQDAVMSSLEESSLAIEAVMNLLKQYNAKQILVYLDACRAAQSGGKDVILECWDPLNLEAIAPDGIAIFHSCKPHQKLTSPP